MPRPGCTHPSQRCRAIGKRLSIEPLAILSFRFQKGGASPGSLLSEVFPAQILVDRWGGQTPPIVTSPLPLPLSPAPTRKAALSLDPGKMDPFLSPALYRAPLQPRSGHGPPRKMKGP